MNRWILSACFLALTAAPVAAADVRLDSYRNPKNEAFRNFNGDTLIALLLLSGLQDTFPCEKTGSQ